MSDELKLTVVKSDNEQLVISTDHDIIDISMWTSIDGPCGLYLSLDEAEKLVASIQLARLHIEQRKKELLGDPMWRPTYQ